MTQETCWTLIHAAALGNAVEREEFTRRYLTTVRAYLTARWQGTWMEGEIDDVVQEVFMACFRKGGALERVDTDRPGGFSAFLYGIVRNQALHAERSRARRARRDRDSSFHPEQLANDEPALSRIYDRAFARSIMREAAEHMAREAQERGPAERRRVELLRLRFEEGPPIRDIARLWDADPKKLHREYAQAGVEFKRALREVIGLTERCTTERLQQECDRLLGLLA